MLAGLLNWTTGAPVVLPILMPAYGRPEYLRQVVAALKNVRGINETFVLVSQDGTDPAVSAVLAEAQQDLRIVHLHHTPPYFGLPSLVIKAEYATSANVRFLLGVAFDVLQAPGVIVLESDLVPSPDFYDYFLWAFQHFLADDVPDERRERVLCVNGFQAHSHPNAGPYKVSPDQFVVWGWATTRRLWPLFREGWTKFQNWDGTVQQDVRRRHGRYCVSPALSRVRNIGMKVGAVGGLSVIATCWSCPDLGINFDVAPEDHDRWQTYMSARPLNYSNQPPDLAPPNLSRMCKLMKGSLNPWPGCPP